MVLNTSKGSIVYRLVSGMVYSNVFIALQALSVALVTLILSGFKFSPKPLFISFAAFFIVYSVDRYLGKDEDKENMPLRTVFIEKYGWYFFVASIAIYMAALLLAFNHGLLVFFLTLVPIVASILYSVLRIKRVLLVKNIVVGVTWGTIPLLTGAFYGAPLKPEIIYLASFFSVSFFRSAMIFDVKDIKGDLKEGVATIPNQFGVRKTKLIAVLINAALIISWSTLVFLGYLSFEYIILIFFHIYIVIYVYLLNREQGELFYSVIIDGECIFLGLLVMFAATIGVM